MREQKRAKAKDPNSPIANTRSSHFVCRCRPPEHTLGDNSSSVLCLPSAQPLQSLSHPNSLIPCIIQHPSPFATHCLRSLRRDPVVPWFFRRQQRLPPQFLRRRSSAFSAWRQCFLGPSRSNRGCVRRHRLAPRGAWSKCESPVPVEFSPTTL